MCEKIGQHEVLFLTFASPKQIDKREHFQNAKLYATILTICTTV